MHCCSPEAERFALTVHSVANELDYLSQAHQKRFFLFGAHMVQSMVLLLHQSAWFTCACCV